MTSKDRREQMPPTATTQQLNGRIVAGPVVADETRARELLGEIAAVLEPDSVARLADPTVERLLLGVLDGSPYLTALMRRSPERLARVLEAVPETRLAELERNALALAASAPVMADLMTGLRAIKAEAALMIALADLGGAWPLMQVTEGLTRIADVCTQAAVRFLFREARAKGQWLGGTDAAPEADSGFIVLGMGKHGAGELNYSSDIDLIVFYDLERLAIREGLEPQPFFVRLTKDLVKILQERTSDGYVFRVDLRLRPDPGATQVAISTEGAFHYYESFGQNWERAAMIKARAIAGDIAAGQAFLTELAPFIWRKYLDFAAIADIHAMKRQINAHRGFSVIGVAGHNVKLGRGGIREVEFFVQTQQLIAGGRQTDLRIRQTLSALKRLVERGWIKPQIEADLARAYVYLRTIEHRVQMVADEQTHQLPEGETELEAFARFAGYAGTPELSTALLAVLETVQRHYAALFEDSPDLTRGGHNMMFAGEADDPATVEALGKLGFSQPTQVVATVRGWHHGRYPAVRSAQARERLTEVQPLLIEALADTAAPDSAFASFDRFLSELPSGVQLFSLLRANPKLLRLVADIMGTAPRLSRILSRRRRVLDAVLDPRVLGDMPPQSEIAAIIAHEMAGASDFQDALDRARVIGNEQAFLIGVRVLTGMISAPLAGSAYAQLAEELICAVQRAVEADFAAAHGKVPGGAAAVLAMGKLGGREMTASSDLDLIVVYDFDPEATQSDGARPLAISQYYARLTQRLITGISAPTAEGQLYEVDMRLRPSGQKGPVATQLTSFIEYQRTDAWTWEHMALTRARVISGAPELRAKVESAIADALRRPRDRARIVADVRDMRRRIAAEKGTDNIWDLKQVRGGLVDLEFMAQYLQLVHAADNPAVLDQNTVQALLKMERAGLLAGDRAGVLVPAARLISDLTQILRLSLDSEFDPATAPEGLKALLARVAGAPTFANLEVQLRETLASVGALFEEVVA
jgi:glutamate-ammonia-ligase adenylyltransferase